MYFWTCFFDRGNLIFDRKLVILCSCGATPWGVMVLPRNSIWVTPKWHFSIVSFSPALRMHLKTALMFLMSCSVVLAAIPMSSTYWAHWSALMTVSRYSCMKLEKADKALLRPWASHRIQAMMQ